MPPKPHTFSRSHGYATIPEETGGEGMQIMTPDDFHTNDAKTSPVFSHTESQMKPKHSITEISPKSPPVSVETPPPEKKKPKGLSKLFGRMRGGSGKSEALSSTPKLIPSKGMRRYRREDSKRSSGTSSSTNSTHSDISQRDDDDIGPVLLRHSDINTEGSDGNQLGIFANSKNRKSFRVSKALRDQHRDGPSLPVKKGAADGQVF